MGVRQPVIEVPQAVESDYVDQVVCEEQHDDIEQTGEEPVEQVPQQDDQTTLKRSTRVKKTTIPSDYVVYLQESDYNIGA